MKCIVLLVLIGTFIAGTLLLGTEPVHVDTKTKAFAYGERAFKVTSDIYHGKPVMPTVYEMMDTGKVEVESTDLGIYFLWKYWNLDTDWDLWISKWSRELVDHSSKQKGAAVGTLLMETGSTLLGTGLSMMIGDILSLGARLPTNINTFVKAGKLVSVSLGLTAACLDTIVTLLVTDKADL